MSCIGKSKAYRCLEILQYYKEFGASWLAVVVRMF